MEISVKDKNGSSVFGVKVDLEEPPSMVRQPDDDSRPITLDWDRPLDDRRHLRHCPLCGCEDLYVKKQLPQLTGFALVLLAVAVGMVLFGIGLVVWAV